MLNELLVLAQRGGGMEVMIIALLPLAAVFWFMMRPQRKRERERREMLTRLKKGDSVVTAGGIYGEITRLNEKDMWLRVEKKGDIVLRFQRSAVAGVVSSKAPLGAKGEPAPKPGEKAFDEHSRGSR